MLTVHHLRNSQSDRIIWLCEELGIPYELKCYDRVPMAAPPEYKAMTPYGTAPTITDGDFALGESGAIVEYICGKYGNGALVLGPDDAGYADYLFWFHFANGSLVPGMMIDYFTKASGAAPTEGPSRSERAYEMTEERLGEAPYFAGDVFTAADVMMCVPWFAQQLDLTDRPNMRAYLEHMNERPAWQRTAALR
jgi:glutathione S-transferase